MKERTAITGGLGLLVDNWRLGMPKCTTCETMEQKISSTKLLISYYTGQLKEKEADLKLHQEEHKLYGRT